MCISNNSNTIKNLRQILFLLRKKAVTKSPAQIKKKLYKGHESMKVTSFDVFLDAGSNHPYMAKGKNSILSTEELRAKPV